MTELFLGLLHLLAHHHVLRWVEFIQSRLHRLLIQRQPVNLILNGRQKTDRSFSVVLVRRRRCHARRGVVAQSLKTRLQVEKQFYLL